MATKAAKRTGEKQILKKHVSAIHIAAPLTLLQRKLVNALLYNAYDELLTAREHTISSALLSEMIGFESKNTGYLKAALKGLMETIVVFDVMEDDGEEAWEAIALLPYAKIKGGTCTYRYERGLAEKLYHPDIYSKINLSVLREMKSTHSLVLYENCHRYLGAGQTAVWDIDIFRRLMGVEDKYKAFKVLKRDVITPAMKEVNQVSNINVELVTVRKGRQVVAIQFIVKPNPQLSMIGIETEDDLTDSKAYRALIDEGISKALARAWILEHDEEYIFEKIEMANSKAAGGQIRKSKTGFLKAAIEENYFDEAKAKRREAAAKEQERDEKRRAEREFDAMKQTLRDAEAAYRKHCVDQIMATWGRFDPDMQAQYSSEFTDSLRGDIYKNTFKKNGWKDRLVFKEACEFWRSKDVALPTLPDFAKSQGIADIEVLREQVQETESQVAV